VKTLDGRGRKAICEVLMMTKAIAKLIQTEQTHQIPTQMQMGRDLGMSLLDQSLLTAITAREVDPDDAYVYALEKKAFQKYVTDTSVLPKVDLTGPGTAQKPISPASA
jgi:twitching motility protein PilT